ncbi:MAG: AAA family ATPase, partial [bacterium]|nr:AAA family ATPase [bacterium]
MLKLVTLEQFRNYQAKTYTFPTPTTVIVGPNAHGKTSVIEAIALLGTGSSFRAQRTEEMIRFDQELARVTGLIRPDKRAVSEVNSDEDEADETTLEAIITRGEVQGKKTQYRLFSVNQVRRRKKDFLGHLTTVTFRPEDMRLIEGSPSRRRTFMDTPLSTLDQEYAQSLQTYEQTLLRRNKLLHAIRENEQPRTVLSYWSMALVKHGEYLQKVRAAFLESLNGVSFPLHFRVVYQPSIISAERLAEYADREVIVGHTMIGPHKDDFQVTLPASELRVAEPSYSNVDTAISPSDFLAIEQYGSRGQQRLAVLWL